MEEKATDLEIDVDDIGTILKSSRLKQKKTLEEISSELCIRKIYLTALEEGNYDVLPPIPYGIGYIRTYARFLGLNPERAVKLYKAAAGIENDTREDIPEEKTDVNRSNSRHVVIGAFSVMGIYAGWSLYMANVAPKSAENPTQEIISAKETSVSESMVEQDIQPSSDISESIETPQTDETQDKTPEDTLNIQENRPPLTDDKNEESEVPTVVKNDIVIKFIGETWIELRDKKRVYFQGVFHQGDKKELEYSDNLFLSVGRPHNLKVFIRGVEKDIVASKRKMNIPLDSLN